MTTESITRETSAIEQKLELERAIVTQYRALVQQLPQEQEDTALADLEAWKTTGKLPAKSTGLAAVREAELERLRGMERAAQQDRINSIYLEWSDKGASLREQAANLRAEAYERQKQTDAMLHDLADWEECDLYIDPWTVRDRVDRALAGVVRADKPPTKRPRTMELLDSAINLGKEAGTWESKRLNRNGYIEEHTAVHTLEEVLDYIYRDPYHVGCSAIEAVDWFEKAAAAEEQRRTQARQRSGDLPPVRIMLSYKDGGIDERQSRVYTPAMY